MGRKKKNEKEAFAADLHDIMDGAGTMKDTEIAEAFVAKGWRKRSEGEWISVEERLPDNDWGKHWKERKYYLVFTKPSGLMNVAVYGYKEHDWWIDRNSCVLDKKNYNEVTHWMPLPEPPKGEKHDPA